MRCPRRVYQEFPEVKETTVETSVPSISATTAEIKGNENR